MVFILTETQYKYDDFQKIISQLRKTNDDIDSLLSNYDPENLHKKIKESYNATQLCNQKIDEYFQQMKNALLKIHHIIHTQFDSLNAKLIETSQAQQHKSLEKINQSINDLMLSQKIMIDNLTILNEKINIVKNNINDIKSNINDVVIKVNSIQEKFDHINNKQTIIPGQIDNNLNNTKISQTNLDYLPINLDNSIEII